MLKQHLNFKLLQKLSPQQIQLMKLIQLPTQAFEERLKQEIEENPALDTGSKESEDFDDTLSNNEYDDDGTEKIDAEDINIDEYLSDDEIPNYKTQANILAPFYWGGFIVMGNTNTVVSLHQPSSNYSTLVLGICISILLVVLFFIYKSRKEDNMA